MPVVFEVKLVAVCKKAFDNNEGEHINYNEHYFLNENAEGEKSVIKLNTRQDYSESEGKTGKLEIEVDPTGSRKPRLIKFTV